MRTSAPAENPAFQKAEAPCLYRYPANEVYYAPVKHEGNRKRASLETTDKAVARRKPGDRHLAPVQNRSPATVGRKKHLVARLPAKCKMQKFRIENGDD